MNLCHSDIKHLCLDIKVSRKRINVCDQGIKLCRKGIKVCDLGIKVRRKDIIFT